MARRHEQRPSSGLARHPRFLAVLALLLLGACGGSQAAPATNTAPAPVASAAPAQAKEQAPEPPPPPKTLPTACADPNATVCVPPADFVKRLCGGNFQEATFALFSKGTPWVRGYLTRTTDAWNTSGGMASSEKVETGEEVLILVHRAPDPNGMIVSGASGGYDVLRWNGSCATLMGDEVTMRPPGEPKYANVVWKHLDDNIQKIMLEQPKISKLVDDQRRECKSAATGDKPSWQCGRLTKKLAKTIVEYVRNGGTLPELTHIP